MHGTPSRDLHQTELLRTKRAEFIVGEKKLVKVMQPSANRWAEQGCGHGNETESSSRSVYLHREEQRWLGASLVSVQPEVVFLVVLSPAGRSHAHFSPQIVVNHHRNAAKPHAID